MKSKGDFFNLCGERCNCSCSLKLGLKFKVKVWFKLFCLCFLKIGVHRLKSLRSITATRVMKLLDFVSIDEKQVTEIVCLIGI